MPGAEPPRTKPRISADLKAHIVNLASSGKFELDDLLDKRYSRSTHFRAKRQLNDGGNAAALKHGKSPGRPSKLGLDELKWIRQLIKHRPNIQRRELCQMLANYLDIKVAETTVGRFLKRNDITRKKLSARARRRDPLQRTAYRLTMSQFEPEQLVFADETHTNRRTAWRQYGWAPSDERAVMYKDLERGTKFTLLPGMTLDGIIAPFIVPGAVTQELFEYWVERILLPNMNPSPQKNSILVLDNCSVHKSQRLLDLLREKRCVLVYLPPYSPDFNPIELAFGTIKAAIRRSQWSILQSALRIRGAHARAFFRACGYGNGT